MCFLTAAMAHYLEAMCWAIDNSIWQDLEKVCSYT